MTGKSDKDVVTIDWGPGSYTGEVSNGVPHGKGTFTHVDGYEHEGTYIYFEPWEYVGEWKDGKEHGQGTETWPDGQMYVGEYKNGHMHGQGTYTQADGSTYVGEYKNGKYHQGTTLHADGSKYVGTYKDEKFDGDIDTIIDESLFGGPKYIGQWKVDNPWNGTEYDKDGNVVATYSEGIKTENKRNCHVPNRP